MKSISADQASTYQRTTLVQPRSGSGIPHGLKMVRLLGKGSNNAVYLGCHKHDPTKYVIRIPRRKSDTQRIGNASWEFRNTAIASTLGVAPKLYDAWYTRHATKRQRSGLHMIAEYFPYDVHNLLVDEPVRAISIASELGLQAREHLRKMANADMLCYDLKPSNMVFSDEGGCMRLRFIDFGRDFCEWKVFSDTNEHIERAPVLSYVERLANEHCDERLTAKELYHELIYATMIVILSSNIAYTLSQSIRASRCSSSQRHLLNFMAETAFDLRQYTRSSHICLIKKILRHTEVRETLRHYMGRRNSGTKRVFSYASFTKQEYET